MKSILLVTILGQLSGSALQSERDLLDAYQRHLLRPEATARWQMDADRDCRSSTADCVPAYLAAKYSEVAMLVCRRAAAAEFTGQHGGTATTFAQHSIRRSCEAAIKSCRSAWRSVDAINFKYSSSGSDPARVAHFERVLTDRCGAEANVSAPF